eukprot:CAMPEP_0176179692 /NCGR_PEP_ID=MMETSP0120_2-20121206/92066_1 /TAXON_ID=160619 /ORGANISM="Kryptoperidinium foliaceum, Strain CCMP 1326" /LENGTH=63 /DNA_ID=CAMNT_0017517865 /DNA_START=286 /DNA_END=477 /DNA_ORIENTATION=-
MVVAALHNGLVLLRGCRQEDVAAQHHQARLLDIHGIDNRWLRDKVKRQRREDRTGGGDINDFA